MGRLPTAAYDGRVNMNLTICSDGYDDISIGPYRAGSRGLSEWLRVVFIDCARCWLARLGSDDLQETRDEPVVVNRMVILGRHNI